MLAEWTVLALKVPHNVLIYTEYHSVCPLVGIGTPTTPLPRASGWGGTLACGWGAWGSPNSDDWRKGLALCLLCVVPKRLMDGKERSLGRLCSSGMLNGQIKRMG
jgi:hypothetical protein